MPQLRWMPLARCLMHRKKGGPQLGAEQRAARAYIRLVLPPIAIMRDDHASMTPFQTNDNSGLFGGINLSHSATPDCRMHRAGVGMTRADLAPDAAPPGAPS